MQLGDCILIRATGIPDVGVEGLQLLCRCREQLQQRVGGVVHHARWSKTGLEGGPTGQSTWPMMLLSVRVSSK